MPMVFTAHFALSFILHADYFKASQTEMRREMVAHIKAACRQRQDPLEYLQTGKPRPASSSKGIAAREKRKPPEDVPAGKFDPLSALTRASKLAPRKTLAEAIKESSAQDQDEI